MNEKNTASKALSDARGEIDALDREIVSLFEKRLSVCRDIAKIKLDEGLAVSDPSREDAVIAKVVSLSGKENADAVARLYKEIFSISKDTQKEIINSK